MSPAEAASPAGVDAGRDLASEVERQHWYHTIELPGGVVTPGWFDPRPTVAHVPLPPTLEGRRCLDVGTWDGFWAFEMERRGASEIVAIDIEDPQRWDWPAGALESSDSASGLRMLDEFKSAGAAFELARRALGSRVQRVDLSVYDLDPREIGGFDFVFLGSLLLHLRDPIAALGRLRTVCSGEAVVADTVQWLSSLLRPRAPVARLYGLERPWWWIPNVAGLQRMVQSAGFRVLAHTGVYRLPLGTGHPARAQHGLAAGVRQALRGQNPLPAALGIPHAAVRAAPAPR